MGKARGKAAPEDLWQTDDSYDPNEFYTASADRRGHSDTFYVKVPPYVASALSQFIQSGKVPQYKTVQDFIRDAIVHRIHYLMYNWPGELDECAALLRMQHKLAKLKENEETFQRALEDLAELIRIGQRETALEQYRELLEITLDTRRRQRILAAAKQFFPDEPWPAS